MDGDIISSRKLVLILCAVLLAGQAALAADDSTDISIGVDYSCHTELTEFKAPGDGVVSYGEVSYFIWDIVNSGSIDANVTGKLNVIYEGNESWDEGEPIGVGNNSDPVIKRNLSEITLPNQTYQDGDGNTVTAEDSLTEQFLANATLDAGWYTGRSNLTTECYDVYTNNTTGVTEKNYSKIINYSRFAYVNFKLINASGGVSNKGNQSTNQTVQSNVSEYDDETSNQTVEQEANRTGEEGQTVEGDNAQPGQTPVPEPEPDPEPVPMLSLDIESKQYKYTARRGQFTSVNLTLVNEGNIALSDVSILPQISEIREGWNTSNAQVANLGVNETVHREILVQPPADAEPGSYVVPVLGKNPDNDLDVDYFTVEILSEDVFESQMSIVEAPREINVLQNTTTPLPVLVKNTGGTNLTAISARVQNVGDCGEIDVSDIGRIAVDESESLNVTFKAAERTESCNTTLILSSEEGAYTFTEMQLTVSPKEGLIPEEYRVPFIAVAWTSLLAAFAVLRRRYGLDSVIFKAPFVLLIMGETLIFIFLVVDYYGLLAASFLPF